MGSALLKVEPDPSPLYRIKRNGEVVTVAARWSGRGWSLQQRDLDYVFKVVAEIERACRYFHQIEPRYPLNPEFDVLTDEQVEARILKLDTGEHTRETRRANKRRFPLTKLPLLWKRALVANLDQIACEWGFEKLE